MNHEIMVLWTPLRAMPLLWIVVTLAAYLAARWLQRRCRGNPALNSVLIAIVAVGRRF
jgi:putative effector of murein hydrolase